MSDLAAKLKSAMSTRAARKASYGPSTLVRLTSVNAEANTFSGVVIGGKNDGQTVSDISITGKTRPADLTKKSKKAYIEPAKIEAGEAVLVVDGLKEVNGKMEARWIRFGSPHCVVSTDAKPSYMKLITTEAMWPEEDGDEPSNIKKQMVVVMDVTAAVQATTPEELEAAYLELAGRNEGRGSFHMALIGPDGTRIPVDQFAARGVENPTAESRFANFVAKMETAAPLAELMKDYSVTLIPTEVRLLSKFETERMERSGQGERFQPQSHASRIQATLMSKDDAEVAKMTTVFETWCKEQGLGDQKLDAASDATLSKFAGTYGVSLPEHRSGFLPTGITLRGEDEPGKPLQLIKNILQTANVLPDAFVPIPGDENAPARYYDVYKDLVTAVVDGPVKDLVANPVAQAAAEASPTAAEQPVPEGQDYAADDEELDDVLAGLGN